MGKLVRTNKRMQEGGPIPVMQRDHTKMALPRLRPDGYDSWRQSLPVQLQNDHDYDLQGYYNKYGNRGPAANGHLPDEFKKPNHVTFSNESIYSNPKTPGGQWSEVNGKWHFKPSQYNIQNVGPDSLKNYFKQNEPDSQLDMKKNGGAITKKNPGAFIRKKMEQGGWTSANDWANNNQAGISSAANFAGATVDAFAPVDSYGVRSNGAAVGSGALKGAATGAALGSAIPVVGTIAGGAIGAGVGTVTGLVGNNKAKHLKTEAINASTRSQLSSMEQGAEARIAGDPSLKYGKQNASYYRFGGTMKGTGPTPVRLNKPMPAVQGKPRLMPNIADVPGRQISRMEDGGGIHIKPENRGKFTAYKQRTGKTTAEALHSPDPHVRQMANFARNTAKWDHKANGGEIEPLSTEDAKINGPSHDAGGVKIPAMGVELEGGETVNNGFVFSKKLGFAKPAEKIARALGKAEARPESDINKATINALQRKTELLKVQQEMAKRATGIPSDLDKKAVGGPIMPTDSLGKVPSTYDPSLLLPGNKHFMTSPGADGKLKVWGNDIVEKPLPNATQSLTPAGAPVPMMSDKARGFSNAYYPSRDQQRGPSVPTQYKSANYGSHYKFGGKIKKMADGGDPNSNTAIPYLNVPKFDPNSPAPTIPFTGNTFKGADVPEVTIKAKAAPKAPVSTIPELQSVPVRPLSVSSAPAQSTSVKANVGSNAATQVADGFAAAAPFLSNYVNATTKLPLPPVPILNDEITPNLVDYSASRAEAVRSARGADKAAAQVLNTGAAVSATKAANLAQQVRSVGQINEAENNTNAQIRNQTAAQNAGIKAQNNAIKNNYQDELVSRQIKQQNLKSANIANIEEKIQGMARDKKMYDNEDTKLMLTALADDTGASWRGAQPLFQKHLSPESYKQVEAHFNKLSASNAEDRAAAKRMGALQEAYMNKAINSNLSDSQKSQNYVLNGASTVIPGKEKRSGTKVITTKNGNQTTRESKNLYN